MPPLIILTFVLFALPGISQERPVQEHLTDQIRSNFGEVKNLYQAPDGLIWMGAQPKGLAYYDGKNITHVPLDGEEQFTKQAEVFTAGDTVLYLNMGRHVAVFSLTLQKITGKIELPKALPRQDNILHLSYSNSAEGPLLWAALSPSNKQLQPGYSTYRLLLSKNGGPFQFISNDAITTQGHPAFTAYKNHVLVKETGRFLELDQSGKTVRSISLPGIVNPRLNQWNLCYDGHDGLWFSVPDSTGLVTYGLKILPDSVYIDFTHTKVGGPYGANQIQVRNGTLFICNAFMYAIDIATQKTLFYRGWGGAPQVNCGYKDSQGVIWYGSGEGLEKVHLPPDVFKKYNFTINRGIAEDAAGRIYVGYNYTNIGSLDPEAGLPAANFETSRIVYALQYFNGKLYWGHERAAPEPNWKAEQYMPSRFGLSDYNVSLIDKKGHFWTISWRSSRLLIIDPVDTANIKSVHIPALGNNSIEMDALYQRSSDGTVWLGTHGNGAFVFSETGDLLDHYTANPKSAICLANHVVTSFFEDEKKRLWIGHGAGLSRLAPDGKALKNYVIDPDEPYFNLVYGILPEKGPGGSTDYLWLSTNRGLYRFDVQTGEAMGFPLNQELMQAEFNRTSYYKAKNGRMYFGTNRNGLYAFYPKAVLEIYGGLKGENLPIIINHYAKYDPAVKAAVSPLRVPQLLREIRLEHGERYFELEFSVADFRIPAENYYSYMLEGYDDDWKRPSQNNNRVHYENLPPGTYTLRLRGGLFKSSLPFNERSIRVQVFPAWYASWWAYGLYATFLFGGIYRVYRFNLNRQMEKQEAAKIKELDALKTRLYTNITHEFRTPLTVIMGMADNIRGQENERSLIRRNSRNLLVLVNQMLDLSKLDSGAMQLDLIQADIINYLKYLLESFHSMAEEKGIRLAFASEVPELVMDYDEAKLQQIVYNLLSNAIKFTPAAGGGVIILSVSLLRKNKQACLEIQVPDKGVGIAPGQLPHVFDRFYQVDNTMTRAGEGSGIGLALTKELVELMGGAISVQSKQGAGSAFTVQLPVKREAEKAVPQPDKQACPVPDAAVSRPAQAPATDDKPQLLIIEDNPDIIAYLRSILESDYGIETAPDGQAGIDKALELVPDSIITDVMMPLKDGFEVCQTLKTDARTSHIPIIMLTAKATEADRLAGLRTGADAYLMKPFNKEELFVRLEKLIQLRRSLQERYAGAADPDYLFRPADSPTPKTPSLDEQFLQKIRQTIDANLGDPDLGIAQLCKAALLSHTQLFRKLKALTGEHPSGFIRKVRLHKGRQLLQTTELNIAAIAYEVGFTDPNHFSRAFSQEFGMPPSAMRK
ncbi:MAG: response regulator [Lewinellaceae bacterium]|nr:response regulator [Lewinellaceae bacterium]